MDRAVEMRKEMEEEGKTRERIQMERMLGGEVRKYQAQQDLSYERSRDSKLFAGLMSLDEIKAKKARIDSGEEFEGALAKAARMKKLDDVAAEQERQARDSRLIAKREKDSMAASTKTSEPIASSESQKKEKKIGKRSTATLSFNTEDE